MTPSGNDLVVRYLMTASSSRSLITRLLRTLTFRSQALWNRVIQEDLMKRILCLLFAAEEKLDKRRVWSMGEHGSNPHFEALHFRCALDGTAGAGTLL